MGHEDIINYVYIITNIWSQKNLHGLIFMYSKAKCGTILSFTLNVQFYIIIK